MKSLLHSFPQPLPLSHPPQWNPKTPIRRPTIRNSSRTRKLPAQTTPKGFVPSPAPAKYSGDSKIPGQISGDEEEIPEAVFNRIIRRILVCVGAPMAVGIGVLKIIEAIKEGEVWDVPNWVPYLTTFLTFGASTMGIAYGSLSTSLDPKKNGSVLGWEEAQKNWVEMWSQEEEDESDR